MDGKPNYYARTRAKRDAVNEAEFGLGYLYRTFENQIDDYGAQTGYAYSVAYVAFRLGRLLTSKALRTEPGLAELVPEMREDSARALLRAENGPIPPVNGSAEEVHVRTRAGRPLIPGILRATELGRPLTKEEKRANWRLLAQRYRDQQVAQGLSTHDGKPRKSGTGSPGQKRVLTPKMLRAMRRNAKLARAAHVPKRKGRPPMSAEQRAQMSVAMKAAYARKRAASAAGAA